MQEYPTLAAVDLGSNSFHLQLGRVEGEQLYDLDAIKESVRLAGGLTANKMLDGASQRRALNCLARFGERLRGMPPGAVRAVGTSALRVAKNAAPFLDKARAALGFDIDIVAGREEARLIYLGVSHSLPLNRAARLVVDIGGGSTECILGVGYEPRERESLRMGCVVYSLRFFPGGQVDGIALRAAETAARIEIRNVTAGQFRAGSWREAVGSSGTAKALGEICRLNGFSDGALTLEGLKWLRERLVKAGNAERLDIPGLKADRRPVLAGGLAIMYALFLELGIDSMTAAQGAMREGILWDLLGRVHDRDMRDVTVGQLQQRYQVDTRQAGRVERLAQRLFEAVAPRFASEVAEEATHRLLWAARLHEVGISIAHSGQHKHAAYILENADMPGFSRRDQIHLAVLVRASRGGLDKLGLSPADAAWPLILCLRLSVLLNVSRIDAPPPDLGLDCADGDCRLCLPERWLAENPLTRAMLEEELAAWGRIAAETRLIGLKVA